MSIKDGYTYSDMIWMQVTKEDVKANKWANLPEK